MWVRSASLDLRLRALKSSLTNSQLRTSVVNKIDLWQDFNGATFKGPAGKIQPALQRRAEYYIRRRCYTKCVSPPCSPQHTVDSLFLSVSCSHFSYVIQRRAAGRSIPATTDTLGTLFLSLSTVLHYFPRDPEHSDTEWLSLLYAHSRP